MKSAATSTHLRLLETVRCLDCGGVYSKPSAGDTVTRNPGCPACGYVGLRVGFPTAEPPKEEQV